MSVWLFFVLCYWVLRWWLWCWVLWWCVECCWRVVLVVSRFGCWCEMVIFCFCFGSICICMWWLMLMWGGWECCWRCWCVVWGWIWCWLWFGVCVCVRDGDLRGDWVSIKYVVRSWLYFLFVMCVMLEKSVLYKENVFFIRFLRLWCFCEFLNWVETFGARRGRLRLRVSRWWWCCDSIWVWGGCWWWSYMWILSFVVWRIYWFYWFECWGCLSRFYFWFDCFRREWCILFF